METSIDHLPEIKNRELESIVAVIKKNCDNPEKIILFWSYDRLAGLTEELCKKKIATLVL